MRKYGPMKNKTRKCRLPAVLLAAVVFICTESGSARAGAKPAQFQMNAENSIIKTDTGKLLSKTDSAGSRSQASAAGKWKTRNQRYFYYVNGKKAKGLVKAGNRYYYFDDKGIQRTGWQKYNGSYYFFKIANETGGYMVRSKTVNGIRLAKNGKAQLTSQNKTKLDVMLMANKIAEKAARPAVTKAEKLKKCFDYLVKHYQYRGSPHFTYTKDWEQVYALRMFREGHGSCYEYGAAFAFLANAAGYQNCYAVSSGGHGWAEAGGKVYDPAWSLIDKKHDYFGVDFALSGVDGRPGYKRARRYVAKI